MQLWLTVVDPSAPVPAEIWVRASNSATVGDLRRALTAPAELYVAGQPLPDSHLLGLPPLLDGAVLELTPNPPTPRMRVEGPLIIAVVGGPDAGMCFQLGPGRHTLGRGLDADLRIDDPDLSRRHLQLDVRPGRAEVSDLRSTNGSRLGDRTLMGAPTPWSIPTRLRVGGTTLELRTHGSSSAATIFDGEGHIAINRQPRPAAIGATAEIRLPAEPEARSRGRLPVLPMTVPLLLAVPMAWLQRSAAYLLFGLMSPAMMLGGYLSERRGGRREGRVKHAEWEVAVARARTALAEALSAEAATKRAALPDPAELLQTVRTPLVRLWERRPSDPDFLRLRIGLTDLPADVGVVGAVAPAAPVLVEDVPAAVSLLSTGVLGVCGARRAQLAVAGHLIAQVAAWHSPRDVSVVLLTATTEGAVDWTWATRLPHARPDGVDSCWAWLGALDRPDQVRQRLAELIAILDERLAARRHQPGDRWAGPFVVALLDGARALRDVPGLARVLAEGPGVGILAICLDLDRSRLPVECVAVIEFPPTAVAALVPATVTGVPELPPSATAGLRVDGVSADWAERFGRAMAPLRDATPDASRAEPPDQARLLDLLDLDLTDPAALPARWRGAPRSTVAVLGVTTGAAYSIDLRHDGPHILVGGTTGSGKSELLQTLIAALAVANSPEHLGFVLVDYKGGSAFDACAELPHTLGLVTDLDPHLTERALTSLGAELTRREALLREVGAANLDDYLRRVGPGGPSLPRLVLVIDEFRMLAEELPAFLDGMVRIGAVGRSLGVHLVLATQRPAGIVSADIAANVNLRIALRVRDQTDSEDVIESRAAAAISARTPGRALARSGANPLALFQTARVSGSVARPAAHLDVRTLSPGDLGELPTPTMVSSSSSAVSSDLQTIVKATQSAARELALPPIRRPWLPPLPDLVTLGELATATTGWRIPYAVVDRPDRQAQETLAWDLERDAHLVIVGTLRSGRSTCLRTLAGAAAAAYDPQDVHLHGIDGGAGSLRALSVLPHAGVIAARDDIARGVLLLDRLADEVAARQSLMSAAGFGALAEQHAEVEPADRLPYVLLMLDGWESLATAWEQVDHGRPIETLLGLMRDGGAVGMRVVVTGDRALLTSRVAALAGEKIVLRLADPSDLVLVGVPSASVPRRLPPGRAIRVSDHTELQVAVLSADPSGPGQSRGLHAIAARARARSRGGAAHQLPLRISSLPRLVRYAELAEQMAASGSNRVAGPGPGWTLVGAGGDACEPTGLRMSGTSAIIAGPAGSGRTTALATMARWLAGHDTPVIAVGVSRSALADGVVAAGGQLVGPDQVDRLRSLVAERPDSCLLIDDAERLADSEMEDVVLQWFKGSGSGRGALVVAGSSAEMTLAFRGLSVVARRSGQGILLGPTSYAEGELLGVRTPSAHAPSIPGRGLLVRAGQAIPVQVAL